MNTKYTIKNFRVFDEKGVTVDIKPITILTGCNSSGKSSIVKSMVLLDTYLNDARLSYNNGMGIDLQKYNLNFHKKSTSSLGNFERVLNRNTDESTIAYEYKLHSLMLGEDIKISLVFYTNSNDIRKEGKLYSFSIHNLKDQIIYSTSKKSSVEFNFDLVKNNFARFALGIIAIEKYQIFQAQHNFSVYEAEKEYESFGEEMPQAIKMECENIKKLISLFEEKYNQDAFADIIQWYVAHDKDHLDIFDKTAYHTPVSYLFDKTIKDPEKLVISLVKNNTLFYFPFLDDISHATRENFLSIVKELIGNRILSKETLYGLNKIAEDFFESSNDEFIDYFRYKERDVLNRSIPDIQGFMPIVSPVRWIAINQVMEDRYYESASYFLGPGITYFPDGSADEINPKLKKNWEDSTVTFCTLYDVLMNINEILYPEKSPYYFVENKIRNEFNFYSHYLLGVLKEYVSILTQETLINLHSSGLDYLGTSIVNVKRSYPLDNEDEFTAFLHSYFEAREKYLNERESNFLHRKFGLYEYKPDSFLNKWIREFGLGHSISIEIDTEGQGITFKLYKDENDTEGHLVAEEGYGVTQLLTLLLRIERSILLSKMYFVNDNKSNIDLATYSLTRDNSLVHCHFSESNIAIEEPEVHLHPKFQSELAEMFIDAYTNYNVHFIIETHSEYIIRKLQLLVAKKIVANSDISILYVYDKEHKPGYEPLVKQIGIRKDGMLNGNFGEGFFDEADMLSMFLLTAQSDDNV